MEPITLKKTVSEMADAIRTLEIAKSDCKVVIDAAWEAYEDQGNNIHETKQAVVKLAKAYAKNDQIDKKVEADKFVELCEKLGI